MGSAKGLYLNGTGVAGSTTKSSSDFRSNLVTLEFVCRNESEPYSIFFNPGLNLNVLIYTGKDRRVGFWSPNLGVQAVYPGYRPAEDTNYSYSVVYDYHSGPSGVRDFMVGGVVQESDPLDNYLSISDALPHLGGRTGATNQRIAKGDLLAVRMYNRVLTDDERRTNAWVDSQRFGTPYFVAKGPKKARFMSSAECVFDGNRQIYTFTCDGTLEVFGSSDVDILLVGGGGGGGAGVGGGGGGGGVVQRTKFRLEPGVYKVKVGVGGAGGRGGYVGGTLYREPGENGGDSSFGTFSELIAYGGGGGGGGGDKGACPGSKGTDGGGDGSPYSSGAGIPGGNGIDGLGGGGGGSGYCASDTSITSGGRGGRGVVIISYTKTGGFAILLR